MSTNGWEEPMAVKPIPEGYHSLNPYLSVNDAAAAIEYYSEVFGAKERMRMDGPDGLIGHAELQIGDSVLMLADPRIRSRARRRRRSSEGPPPACCSTSRTSTQSSPRRPRRARR